MRRMFKYKDADGKPMAGMQNVDSDRNYANFLLGQTAHRNLWTDLEVFDHRMPDHEIKRHVDEIQAKNGQPLLYADHEKQPPPQGAPAAPIIVIKDHADGQDVGIPANAAEARPGNAGPMIHPPPPPQIQIVPGRVGVPQPQAVRQPITTAAPVAQPPK